MFVKFTGSFPAPGFIGLLSWTLLGLALTSSSATAQTSLTEIPARQDRSAYLQDGRGLILRSSTGLCWRSGFWTPADAVAGCDGSLAPPISKLIAPDLPQEAPAPVRTMEAAPVVIPTRPAATDCNFEMVLEGDQAFAFGGAALNAKGRLRLEQELLPKLKACPSPPHIRLIGHTDRLGSAAYNRRLSQQRAQAVADYLEESGATPRLESVETIGAGASQARLQCESANTRAALIACLAPDRRVLIEVHGTQK